MKFVTPLVALLTLLVSTHVDAQDCPDGNCYRVYPQVLPSVRPLAIRQPRSVRRPQVVAVQPSPVFAWDKQPVIASAEPQKVVLAASGGAPPVEITCAPNEIITSVSVDGQEICLKCGGVKTYQPAATTVVRASQPVQQQYVYVKSRRLLRRQARPVYAVQQPATVYDISYSTDAYGQTYKTTTARTEIRTGYRMKFRDGTGWRLGKAIRTRRFNKAMGY